MNPLDSGIPSETAIEKETPPITAARIPNIVGQKYRPHIINMKNEIMAIQNEINVIQIRVRRTFDLVFGFIASAFWFSLQI